jgi:hypothetical protein
MKKVRLFFPLVVLLLVSCTKDDEPDFELGVSELGKKYESILTKNRAWRVSKVESDMPRHYIHTYFNPEIPKMDSVDLTGTNWYEQMQQADIEDPHFPLERVFMFAFNAKSRIYSASLNLYAKDDEDEEFEFIQFGNSLSEEDYTIFNIRLSTEHISFYGYHNQDTSVPRNPEVWKNFKAEQDRISYQVEKVYNDTTYLVTVELVPLP